MVADPYKALGLPHDATAKQIKDSYRKAALKYHPDRLTRQCATEAEMQKATAEFAKVAAAYALLTDFARKRDYDHIYKYGGYDDDVDDDDGQTTSTPSTPARGTKRQQQQGSSYSTSSSSPTSDPAHKKSARGIGYACTDHLSYILTQGKSSSTSVAGIQMPPRLHMSRPVAGGFRLSFSSGKFTTSAEDGSKRFISKTTQFVAGKKFTRVENKVVHPDGRTEIVIEGDDYVERRTTPPTRSMPVPASNNNNNNTNNGVAAQQQPHQHNAPWYMEAWHGIKDKLTACYAPCLPVHVQ